jgi:hypothetical protein
MWDDKLISYLLSGFGFDKLNKFFLLYVILYFCS